MLVENLRCWVDASLLGVKDFVLVFFIADETVSLMYEKTQPLSLRGVDGEVGSDKIGAAQSSSIARLVNGILNVPSSMNFLNAAQITCFCTLSLSVWFKPGRVFCSSSSVKNINSTASGYGGSAKKYFSYKYSSVCMLTLVAAATGTR